MVYSDGKDVIKKMLEINMEVDKGIPFLNLEGNLGKKLIIYYIIRDFIILYSTLQT